MEDKKKKKKKKKKKSFSFHDFIRSEKTLLGIFCSLLLVVVILFVLVFQKEKELEEHPIANMVIPIYKDSSDYHFSISAKALSEKKQYVFKITNYKDKDVNSEDVHYRITVENDTNSLIRLVKDDTEDNLMTDERRTVIDGGVLTKSSEEEDVYQVTMISHGELDDNQFIRVEVSNENEEQS